MARIGQILVEQGWLTDGQLQTALRNQRILGGRLGTCLLEMGALSEDALLDVLCARTRLPAADLEDLRVVDPEVIQLLSPRLALRYRAVPFRSLGAQVDLVMLGFDNLEHQDELAFGLGKTLRIHVAPEVRVLQALRRYYGAQCPNRIVQILERLDRARLLGSSHLTSDTARELLNWETDEAAFAAGHSLSIGRSTRGPAGDNPERPAGPSADEEAPRLRLVPPGPSPGSPPLLRESGRPASAGRGGDATKPDTGATATGPWRRQVAAAEERLAAAGSAEEIGEALLEALGDRFDRAALFRVRRGRVEGWLGTGSDVDTDGLRSYVAELDETSAFSELDGGAGLFRGYLPSVPAHDDLIAAWDEPTSSYCVLVPIRVADRLVLALYVDRGRNEMEGADIPPLLVLATRAGSALQRCIGRTKAARKPR